MHPFISHTGRVAPLRLANVDTDQICASQFLKRITKSGYEDALFAEWRRDPQFVLNQPAYKDASVLVTGPSFGTGSSREHAVWALRDYGFNVLIGSGFADIFRGNSGKQGLLLVTLPQKDVEALWKMSEDTPSLEITVDLVKQQIDYGNEVFTFSVDPHIRYRLLKGLDDIGATLRHSAEITSFERQRSSWKPQIQDGHHKSTPKTHHTVS